MKNDITYYTDSLERNLTIDFCRCIACIAVVIIHTIAPFWYSTPVLLQPITKYDAGGGGILTVNSIGWNICSVIDAFVRFSVPLFVCISGALMLNKKAIDRRYIIKKILHLLFLIVSWGVVYALSSVLFDLLRNKPVLWINEIKTIILGPDVFWFIFMLIPLYMVAPILKHILENKSITELYIGIWFFLTVTLESAKSWIPLLTSSRFEYISIFSVYSGYFLIGAYFVKYRISKKLENILICTGLLSLGIMIIGKPVGYFHNFTTPFAVIFTLAIMILSYRINWGVINKNIKTAIVKLSKYSMGIYALHILSIQIISNIWKYNEKAWMVQIILLPLCAVLLSICITIIIRKIPFFKKMV